MSIHTHTHLAIFSDKSFRFIDCEKKKSEIKNDQADRMRENEI